MELSLVGGLGVADGDVKPGLVCHQLASEGDGVAGGYLNVADRSDQLDPDCRWSVLTDPESVVGRG